MTRPARITERAVAERATPSGECGITRRSMISTAVAAAVTAWAGATHAIAAAPAKRSRTGDTLDSALNAACYSGSSSSSVSGVAPLYVFFDASDTRSTRTDQPFHECLYSWDFGDEQSGQYAYGPFAGTPRASRNASYGALAGHVFERPGRYAVSCTVFDGLSTQTRTVNVVVTDGAAHEWAGERTMLVSTSGRFRCAGLTNADDATRHVFTDWPTFNAALIALAAKPRAQGNDFPAGPVRVLFRSGETFAITGGGNAYYIRSPSGPLYIGSFDDRGPCVGANAVLQGSGSNASSGVLQLGHPSAMGMCGVIVQDVTIDCSALTSPNTGYGITPKSNCDWTLYRRIRFKSCNGVCISYSVISMKNLRHQRYRMWDGVAVVDCVQEDPSPGPGKPNSLLYAASRRTYVAGNLAYAGGEIGPSSHNIRTQWFDKLVIEHNECRYPGRTQHCLKMHSDEVYTWGGNRAIGTGAFAPSSDLNDGRGEYRRPWHPVQRKLIGVGQQYPVFECTSGCASSSVTFESGSPCVVRDPGHGFTEDQPVSFTTKGSLPGGLTPGTVYHARHVTPAGYELSASPGGASLSTAGEGTGRHTRTCLTWHTEPNWNFTVGATTRDGASVVWTCRDYATIVPQQLSWRTSGEGYASTQAVVRANRFKGRTAPWPVAIGALDDDDFSKAYDITLFQNWWDCADAPGGNTQVALQVWSERVSVYNNVFDLMQAGSPRFVLAGMRPPTPTSTYPAQDVWIYHNEFNLLDGPGVRTADGVFIDPYARRVKVANNLMRMTGDRSSSIRVVNDSTAAPGQAAVAHNAEVAVPAGRSRGSGVVPSRGNAAARGTVTREGAPVSVWQDFEGEPRGARHVPGAFESGR